MEKDYNLWFGKRLKEVMDHFDFTAKSLGEQSGVGRMTISRIIQGRYATAEEVQKIADTMGITVDRLKQKDMDLTNTEQFERNPESMYQLNEAQKALSIALGKTEVAFAYRWLGYVHLQLYQFSQALEAYYHALELLKDTDNHEWLLSVYDGLMMTYSLTKDYASVNRVYLEVKEVFLSSSNEIQLARFLHLKAANLAEHDKRYDEALGTFQKALEIYQDLGNVVDSRRTLMNMGEVCFRLYRFEEAFRLMKQALHDYPNAEPLQYIALTHYKDYIKVCLCLGDVAAAKEMLEQRLDMALNCEYSDIQCHYLLLQEMIYHDGSGAKKVLERKDAEEHLAIFAGMLLCFSHYIKGEHDDSRYEFSRLLADQLIFDRSTPPKL